ncbi:hypothetical protein ZOSMA_573G00030 [Zostera marina]|nr:hypothetical protein ZOSMA_573G00030 [Zostera marina]
MEIIREQIEFYFGDSNYPKDKFLLNLLDKEGWVDIAKIAKFNRGNKIRKVRRNLPPSFTAMTST